MIQLQSNRALYYDDFSREIPGRDDSPDFVEECWQFLLESHAARSPSVGQREQVQKAAGEIVAAKLLASTKRHSSLEDLANRIDAQAAAIDRLLAYVPVRASAVNAARLGEIGGALTRRALELLPRSSPAVVVLDEEDTDTPARHRIVLSVDVSEAELELLSEALFDLHLSLAETASNSEFEAIRLLIETR